MTVTTDHNRILKAHNVRELGSGVVLEFADLQQRCDAYIEKTRSQVRAMIEEGVREAEDIRVQAEQNGYNAGKQQGIQDAEEKIRQQAEQIAEEKVHLQLEKVLPALRTAATQLTIERDRWLTEWEDAAVRVCMTVAEKVVSSKLDLHPELAENILNETLELISGSNAVQLHMHPTDLEQLGLHSNKVVTDLEACGEISFVGDVDITRGGCLVKTQHGIIDNQIESRFQRIADELLHDHN